MDRRQFLLFLGVVFLAITGVSGLIKSTTHAINQDKEASSGFGSNPYGK